MTRAYNANATATAGSVTYSSPNLTWTGDLAVGAVATITFSVTVNNPDNGDKLLATTVTSATAGSNCPAGSTDSRCTSSIQVLVPGLAISVSAGAATTTPGAKVQYTVTVTNTGGTAYTGAAFTDPLGNVLDDASYNADATTTAGSVIVLASPNLTWTGDLAVGAVATITFSVTVSNPDNGNKILSSTITSATPGSTCPAGNPAASCTATVNVAVLTIVNSAGVTSTTPGSVVRFTATFTNSGQVPDTGITVASNITDVVDDATPNGDQTATSGTLSLTATGISWTGSIPVGGTVTITGTVTVSNPDAGNKVLASTITTAAAGSNCPAGGTDPRCSVSVPVLIPALTITATANTGTAAPGTAIGYTVTVTDSGQTPYTGATFTDSLAGALDDASYNSDAATTAGSVTLLEPEPDLDREPRRRGHGDDHVLGHGEQPGYRGQGACDRRHLDHGGQHLPAGRPESRLHRHGSGTHPRPHHRADRHPGDGHAGGGGALHRDGDRLRADPVYRGHVHRPARRGAG